MPDRERYSEAEVQAILKRAAERQHRADLSAEERTTGLSKRELEQVAAAAGIDAQYVRAAALEVDRGTAPPSGPTALERIAGAPTRIDLERTVPGQLDEALWQKLVVELRRTFSTPGIPDQLGAIREWRSNPNVHDQAEIQAEEVDGVVHLTLRRSWLTKASGPVGSAAFFTAFSLFLLLIGVLGDKADKIMPLVGALMAVGVLALVATRVVYPRWTRGQTDRFTGLMDRLEGIVADHTSVDDAERAVDEGLVETEAATGGTTEPVLSLDDPSDESNAPAQNPTRSRQRS
ncbi:MAG: hypothetical protein AAGF99_12180 [Bacteroidota bacterium]